MAKYKMIPVDQETYDKLAQICEARYMAKRGQGAMVRQLVRVEWKKLGLMKFVEVEDAPLSSATTSPQMPDPERTQGVERRNLGGEKMKVKARGA